MRTVFCNLISLRAFLTTHSPRWSSSTCLSWRSVSISNGGREFGSSSARRAPAARGASLAPAAEAGALQQPQVPLCERCPEHTAEVASLLAWRDAALQAVRGVGDSWAQLDDGPSQEDLETELNWLLDDAFAGVLTSSGDVKRMSWRQMERGLRLQQEPAAPQLVHLRVPLEELEALWCRRLERREPLQYLTCSAHWRDMVLSVGSGILIPRPETEQMVDFVAEAAAANPQLARGTWADVGTGSGALAIGVARQLPDVPQVYAVDLNPVAVAYATFNAQRMGVATRVAVLQGSWYEPLQQVGVGQLAGIISNPPYVTAQQMLSLQAEVGRHEPHLALDGGEGLGLDSLEPICAGAATMLQAGGFLALETGGGEQAHYVADLLRRLHDGGWQQQQQQQQHSCTREPKGRETAAGSSGVGSRDAGGAPAFHEVHVRRDYFGVERFVIATRS